METALQALQLEQRAHVRALNDEFRMHQRAELGEVFITIGVQELGAAFVARALQAVRRFDAL